ncbi:MULTISPECIES: hypothetical protein [Pseudomonas]|uniref:hypothetical protein n=1 Tax=Pseudomonas TaxID=286 RepID=UPI001E4A8EFB|nr:MULTISPECIES: hypothetical protein [Pseudomonas]MCD5985414.1 hypothetical protein [Pseudomonas sp. CDFA 610]MCQ9468930.1 hypothetical protein [Pseudomonas alliivorans]
MIDRLQKFLCLTDFSRPSLPETGPSPLPDYSMLALLHQHPDNFSAVTLCRDHRPFDADERHHGTRETVSPPALKIKRIRRP